MPERHCKGIDWLPFKGSFNQQFTTFLIMNLHRGWHGKTHVTTFQICYKGWKINAGENSKRLMPFFSSFCPFVIFLIIIWWLLLNDESQKWQTWELNNYQICYPSIYFNLLTSINKWQNRNKKTYFYLSFFLIGCLITFQVCIYITFISSVCVCMVWCDVVFTYIYIFFRFFCPDVCILGKYLRDNCSFIGL